MEFSNKEVLYSLASIRKRLLELEKLVVYDELNNQLAITNEKLKRKLAGAQTGLKTLTDLNEDLKNRHNALEDQIAELKKEINELKKGTLKMERQYGLNYNAARVVTDENPGGKYNE